MQKRKGDGSSLSKIVLMAFAVMISVGVVAISKNAYDESSKATKIVNELNKNNPDMTALESLGVIDGSALGPSSNVSTVFDGTAGIRELVITDATENAIRPEFLKTSKRMAFATPSFSGGILTVKFGIQSDIDKIPKPVLPVANVPVELVPGETGDSCSILTSGNAINENTGVSPNCVIAFTNDDSANVTITSTNTNGYLIELGTIQYSENGGAFQSFPKLEYGNNYDSATITGIQGNGQIKIGSFRTRTAGNVKIIITVDDGTGVKTREYQIFVQEAI